ncbi:cell division-specific peptidoglycan biosynthesis regulator FtsW [Leucobacter komagatae]|uniref:Probable peptidoglycan glycosyltransferase FtsW n=1 Tax=Leucobacter komagatae TaxID=55969 RepID=A0A542Y2G0_9MICO|nr:putative peptidoglycan glycosyltransferase FtsW [Leucobacter komagatae]TQL42261.1 cell division-specific peptidoglycan biosynthesis regulator FtsW [Leucobacter komagatae]
MAARGGGAGSGKSVPPVAGTRISLGAGAKTGNNRTVALLWGITLFLTGIGLIMVLSASSVTSYTQDQGSLGGFTRQLVFAALGLPLMVFAATRKLDFWKRWAWWFFGAGLLLQALVFTPLGFAVGGNRNWLLIGNIQAQPSEALKLALVVWIGAVLLKKEKYLGQVSHELVPVIFPGALLALGLVLGGRDLGTVLIMAALVIGAMYFGGVSFKSLGIIIAGGVIATIFFVVTSENRMKRLFEHSGGESDYSGIGWQPQHGMWALANGGLFGVGLGGSKAKWNWLPAADNDYIFAIIGEELGFVGAMLVIALFIVLAVLMLRVISQARDRFGRAVVGGALVWIVGQAFVNIGVVIRIFPVLGVPLPLISSGGTALVSCLVTMGVVISVARDAKAYREELAEGVSVAR